MIKTKQKHILNKCGNAEALALLDSEGAPTAPGISPNSIPAGVPRLPMPVVEKLPAIPNEETPAPAQASEEMPIAKADHTIEKKIQNMMMAFMAWTFQLHKANEPRYGCYQPARAYAFQAYHQPLHTPMIIPPLNAPTGHTYSRQGPNYQQYPPQGFGPSIYCDELGHSRTFCPNMRTDQQKGIVHFNNRARTTLAPTGGNGGEISGYRLVKWFFEIREYTREAARQGQHGGMVATTTSPLPPQLLRGY